MAQNTLELIKNKSLQANSTTEEDTTPEPATDLAPPPSPTTTALSGEHLDSDSMYDIIQDTLQALDTTCVDGYQKDPRTITAALQAHCTKRFIPDTEISMLHTQALPMTKEQLAAYTIAKKHRNSLQYRIKELQLPTKTLAEITGARVRVAYRLARYMTHIRGIGGIGQPLVFTAASSNAGIDLLSLPLPYNPAAGWYRGLAPIRNLLAEISEADYTYTYLFTAQNAETGVPEQQIYSSKGMSILPPPIHDKYYPSEAEASGNRADGEIGYKPPWHYRRLNYTPPGYNPEADGPLAAYLNCMEFLVRHLGIGEIFISGSGDKNAANTSKANSGPIVDELDERAAVAALLNPRIARLAWPCRDDIETYEEYVLMPYLTKIAVAKGPVEAIETIKTEMCLTHSEAFDLYETAKTYGEQAYTYDPKREKALMINKLHGLADTCEDAGMVTTQLNSFKTILQVLGLTKHDEESNLEKRDILAGALEDEILNTPALPSGKDEPKRIAK